VRLLDFGDGVRHRTPAGVRDARGVNA